MQTFVRRCEFLDPKCRFPSNAPMEKELSQSSDRPARIAFRAFSLSVNGLANAFRLEVFAYPYDTRREFVYTKDVTETG